MLEDASHGASNHVDCRAGHGVGQGFVVVKVSHVSLTRTSTGMTQTTISSWITPFQIYIQARRARDFSLNSSFLIRRASRVCGLWSASSRRRKHDPGGTQGKFLLHRLWHVETPESKILKSKVRLRRRFYHQPTICMPRNDFYIKYCTWTACKWLRPKFLAAIQLLH